MSGDGKGFYGSEENDSPLVDIEQSAKAEPIDDDPGTANPLKGDRDASDRPEIETTEHDESTNDSEGAANDVDSEKAPGILDRIKGLIAGAKSEVGKTDIVGGKDFGKFALKSFKKPKGDDAPPLTTDELQRNAKKKVFIMVGIGLGLVFGGKMLLEGDKSSPRANASGELPAPDKGSTSIFGNFDPAVGAIMGQVVTSADVDAKVLKSEKQFQGELARLRIENNALRRNEIVIAQGDPSSPEYNPSYVGPKTRAMTPDERGNANIVTTNPVAPVPAVASLPINQGTSQPIINAPPPSPSLGPTMGIGNGNADSPYPIVGQGPSTSTGGQSEFGVSADKVYSYSPVTDAVKGVAGAVSGSIKNDDPYGKDKPRRSGDSERLDPVAIVPATTIVAGVMISGLDAPTGDGASGDPMPVVMQLMDDGTTASFFNVPIKGCRVILAGFGDLPSERVYMRLERLVCIAETGEVYSAQANGVVLGEDGKNGMRGRIVDKQGAIIMRSLGAGILQGVGEVMTTMTQTVSVSAATGLATSPSLGGADLAKAAIGGGLAESANRLSDFYMNQAEKMFPIIEIDAGRDVEVLFTRDLEFFPVSRIMGKSPTTTASGLGGFWDIPVSGGGR